MQLFTELQEKNRALTQAHAQVTESLEQQTATADILQVISRSPTDVQPVFDTIVTSARALTGAQACGVFLLHSDIVSIAAHDSLSDEWRQEYPRVVSANTVTGRAMLERTTVHVKDLEKNPDYEGAPGRRVGIRTVLAVPMLREGQTIGAIAVWRTEVKSFSDKQIALLQTFVDQAIIAIENVRLFKELEARSRELTTTLDRQTTTADVLRIIAQSQTDLQPVLDAIAASAVRLCAASDAVIERLEGDRFYNAAHAGTQMTGLVGLPLPLTRRFPGGRAVLDRTPIIIDDIQLVAESEYPDTLELLRLNTIHSVAEIPLLSEGKPLGSLAVLRAEMRPFTDAEVALLQTFADQAVIAIENVRLFTELQQKNEALTQANAQVTEALDQQTATSEILRVIASSPTDVQPVFDTIAERAMRLCGADQGWVFSFDGELIHVKSLANVSEEGTDAVRQAYPVAPSRGMVTGRAILTGDVVHIPDVRDDPEYSLKAVAETASYRGLLGVPMLHRGRPIGVISVPRTGPGPFSERQIEVLKTFADQAVIAIENVRLFTELQTSNRELTTALDTQTATADILRVISQSQTDVQPVFDAILASAVRLLGAYSGVLTRIAADQIVLAALTSTDDAGDAATRALFPQALQSELSKTGQWDKMAAGYAEVIRERAPLNIADVHTDPRWPETARAYARLRGYRSWAAVPMILRDEAIGTISVTRSEAGGFTDDEIALLKTFADQAVIAIQNVRLFKELEARTQDLTRSVDELTALGEVGRAVSSTLDLETVLSTIVSRAIQLSGTDGGSVYEYDEATEEFSLRASRDLPEAYVEQVRDTRPRKGEGAVGRVALTREPVQIADISDPAAYESRVRNTLLQIGLRALLAPDFCHPIGSGHSERSPLP